MAETMPFKTGDEVEVTSDEDGFRGAWYSATVVRAMPRVLRYTVEYDSLLSDQKRSTKLRETVEARHVRPRPPPSGHRALFELGEFVDGYYNDGWWPGIVRKVARAGARYGLSFPESGEEIEFGKAELRAHLDWVDGLWVTPQKKLESERQAEIELRKGATVEVSSDEEGFRGAWYTATVIKSNGNKTFLVEHHNLKTDDEKDLLRETVDSFHIRPAPPSITAEKFKLLDEVDAWYLDGWWVGVISKVLNPTRYVVYFKQSKEELAFKPDEMRLHHEWMGGRWMRASLDLGF